MVKQEGILQERIANYLVQNYPDVLFHSDYGSGAKLSEKQSAEQKRQNGGRRAWPDMVIAEPKDVYTKPKIKAIFGKYKTKKRNFSSDWRIYPFAGLYLEIKKEGENIFAQKNLDNPDKLSLDGKIYVDKHVREQADVLYKLRRAGYCAEFAIGYDQAVNIITDYLGEPKKQEVEFQEGAKMNSASFITGMIVGAFVMLGILVWLAYKFDGKY